jgi:pimeloyl-ACP methyl ester carboxylesterase
MKCLPLLSILSAELLLITGCVNPRSDSDSNISLPAAKPHFARFGTNQVHYLALGKGSQTVVFVHGWSCNSQFWREQVPALADKARLIFVDLPGHGRSDKPLVQYTMDYFADAVLAVMDDAHVAKATLVGHSMGTPIICRLYARAPQRVAALAAVDGILRRPKMSPEQVEQFIGPFRTAGYRASVTNFVRSMFPNPATEGLRDWALAEVLATPQYVMSSAMDSMFSGAQPAWDLDRVNVPVLVLNTGSPMWTPEYRAYVRSLSDQTDYRTVEGAGHFLMLEKPDEFNAALAEMLREFQLIGN